MSLNQNSEVADWVDVLVGKSILKVDTDQGSIVLNDGTILTITPNSGCWGCVSGNYHLEVLNKVDNVITQVQPRQDNVDGKTEYTLYVYAETGWEQLFGVTGDDGNGWYGTGYVVSVTRD